MQAANDDYTEVDTSTSIFGSSNFGFYMNQIINSDADAVILGITGRAKVNFSHQDVNQGLKDEVAVVSPTQTIQAVRAGTCDSSIGTYDGVHCVPSLDLGDNKQFVEAYQTEEGPTPDSFARGGYDSIRLMAILSS
jgi:branched-chain amino acid transport system substrate-binding protein